MKTTPMQRRFILMLFSYSSILVWQNFNPSETQLSTYSELTVWPSLRKALKHADSLPICDDKFHPC